MSWFEIIAERKILDAQEEGAFENLPGKGKPLNLEVDTRVPPELRMAYRLMREANVLPDWIQMDKEIRQRHERIHGKIEEYARRREVDQERAHGDRAWVARMDGRRDDFLTYTARELRDLNQLIDRFNLIVPATSRQRLRVNLAERLDELEERFPRAHARPDGSAPWRDLIREDRPPTRLGHRLPVRRRKDTLG